MTVLVNELVVKVYRFLYAGIVLKKINPNTMSGFVYESCHLCLKTSSSVLRRLKDWGIGDRVKLCVPGLVYVATVSLLRPVLLANNAIVRFPGPAERLRLNSSIKIFQSAESNAFTKSVFLKRLRSSVTATFPRRERTIRLTCPIYGMKSSCVLATAVSISLHDATTISSPRRSNRSNLCDPLQELLYSSLECLHCSLLNSEVR
jgi:hypothetical protein